MNAEMNPDHDSEPPDGLPLGQRFWALLTLMIAVVMTVMDGAIANVALPAIARDLHAQAADSIWVVNAYGISVMVLLLPFSSAGEILTYRRVSQSGVALFTLASLLCAMSTSLSTLIAARVLQGIGAAAALSVNSALLRYIYPRAMLGRAIGLLALSVGISASIAPSVASAILSVARWPWLFAVNVPFGVIAFLVAGRTLPRTPRLDQPFDWFSAVLCTLSLGALVIGVDGIAHRGRLFASIGALMLSALSAVLLVRRQTARTAPLLPVDLLRIPAFAMAIATSVSSFCAQALAFVGLPFYLQYNLGHGQVATGLLMTPWPLATGIAAPIAGRLSDRYNAGVLGALGLTTLAAGTAGLALLPAHPSNLHIGALMALAGAGFGFFQAPNNRSMLGATPRARSGGASGMLGTARTLGQTLGAALVALVFGLRGDHAGGATLGLASVLAVFAAGVSVSRLRVLR